MKSTICVLLATLALCYAQEKSCGEKYKECRDKAVLDANLKGIFQCGKDYVKCRGGPAVSCVKQCYQSVRTCRAAAGGIVDKAQCWIDGGKCVTQCKPDPNDEELLADLMADEDIFDDGDKTCGETYKECRAKAVADKSLKAIFECGREYVKCRGGPAVACAKQCYKTAHTCRIAASGISEKAKCIKDGGICLKQCKLAPHDEEVADLMADEEISNDDDQSCGEKYNACRNKAVLDVNLQAGIECGKQYLKCRGGPAISCLKQCHETVQACRAASPGILNRAQCWIDGGKCISQCKLAPHDEQVAADLMADDEIFDDEEKACGEKYNACRNKAVLDRNLQAGIKCGKEYLKCRGGPAISCLKQCHATLQSCRAASPGILNRAQCWIDVVKCGKQCKLAPHDEQVAADLMADDVIFSDNDQSCADEYNDCRIKSTGNLKSIYECGTAYLKCRGGPVVTCVKTCHATLQQCRKDSSSILDKPQCWLSFAKCTTACKIAPHNV